MKIKKHIIAAAVSAAAVFFLCSCSGSSELRLGTGNPGGIYYSYGNTLREMDGNKISVKRTEGSQANMRLLDEDFLDLAIVQSDVLAEAVEGSGSFDGEPVERIRAVAGLYSEAFHIVVRDDSGIESLSDLKGKKISVGEEGSGAVHNLTRLLTSAGVSEKSVQTVCMSYTESAEALESGGIDAFFCVLGAPSTVISELYADDNVRLLAIDERTAGAMTELFSGYFSMTIPAGTYSGQDSDIQTIGVKAVLTADSRIDSGRIREVTAALFEKGSSIKFSLSVPEPNLEFAVTDIPCEFHEGAAQYYESAGISVDTAEN